jgi:hypothetical protein
MVCAKQSTKCSRTTSSSLLLKRAWPVWLLASRALVTGVIRFAHIDNLPSGGGRAGIIRNVVAAVDSVCVHRKAPTITKHSSVSAAFNRKGYFATTFLAFVDSQCRFLSVSMPCYSSSHDSTLFACSKVTSPLKLLY